MTVFIASFELLKIKGILFVMVIIYLISRAIEEKKEISRLESRYPDLGIKKYYRYDVKERRKNALIFWLSMPLIWSWCISMILLEENEIVDIDSELLVCIPIASFILTIYLLRKMVKKSNVIGERIMLLRRGIIPDDDTIRHNVVEEDLWIQSGDAVGDFSGANEAIGTLVLRFESQERLTQVLADQETYVQVKVR